MEMEEVSLEYLCSLDLSDGYIVPGFQEDVFGDSIFYRDVISNQRCKYCDRAASYCIGDGRWCCGYCAVAIARNVLCKILQECHLKSS